MSTSAWPAGSTPATRWRPAPLLKVSLALHVVGVMAFVLHPASWQWIVALLAGNHLLIIVSVFCPRGQLLGPNLVRLPAAAAQRGEVALTFDDGPDPYVTPRVLDLLDCYQMKATFFCTGVNVRAHPDVVQDIVRRGHAVENHSFDHVHWFAMLGPWRMLRDIEAAQSTITRIAGDRPRFFRAPNGFRNPWLDPLLARHGLRYVSWTRRGLDTVRRDAQPVTRALTRGLAAGDVLLMHDGSCGRTAEGKPMVLTVLPVLLDRLRGQGLNSVSLRTALEPHQSSDS